MYEGAQRFSLCCCAAKIQQGGVPDPTRSLPCDGGGGGGGGGEHNGLDGPPITKGETPTPGETF